MENKFNLTLNVTPKDAVEVVLMRFKTAVQDLGEAYSSLQSAVEWFDENRDSIIEFLNQTNDVRKRLFSVDSVVGEYSQILARLMMIQAAEHLPPQHVPPDEGILEKALENLEKEDKEPEKE